MMSGIILLDEVRRERGGDDERGGERGRGARGAGRDEGLAVGFEAEFLEASALEPRNSGYALEELSLRRGPRRLRDLLHIYINHAALAGHPHRRRRHRACHPSRARNLPRRRDRRRGALDAQQRRHVPVVAPALARRVVAVERDDELLEGERAEVETARLRAGTGDYVGEHGIALIGGGVEVALGVVVVEHIWGDMCDYSTFGLLCVGCGHNGAAKGNSQNSHGGRKNEGRSRD
ncbi:hypothetical protein B0H12DRAFT_1118061 [Mycena haematopus]|nr:hypothetical protein B0H12DRAFT_1118061 [Mycena haematopus]